MEAEASQSDQTQSEHQVAIPRWQPIFMNLMVSVQTKDNEWDIGDGVDKLGNVLAVLVVPFAPKLGRVQNNQRKETV